MAARATTENTQHRASPEHAAWLHTNALIGTLEQLAIHVGRLRRRLPEDDYNAHLIDEISSHVNTLDAIVQPTAAELHQAGVTVTAALTMVDRRATNLRQMFGEPPR